jgi:hypothetical protein
MFVQLLQGGGGVLPIHAIVWENSAPATAFVWIGKHADAH